jgi:hypothetical protein
MKIQEIKTQLRLHTLINKAKRGEYVSMRDLESVLGSEGIAEYRERWEWENAWRQQCKDVPFWFRHYVDLLHDADFAHLKLRYAAESRLCQAALEELEAILLVDPSLCACWLDRPAIFDGADAIGPDVESMPRLITSKSQWNENPCPRPLKKRDVMLCVLESALSEMTRQKPSEPEIIPVVSPELLLANARQLLNRVKRL